MKPEKCNNPQICEELRQLWINVFHDYLVANPNSDKLGNIYRNPKNPRQIIVEVVRSGKKGFFIEKHSFPLHDADCGSIPRKKFINFGCELFGINLQQLENNFS